MLINNESKIWGLPNNETKLNDLRARCTPEDTNNLFRIINEKFFAIRLIICKLNFLNFSSIFLTKAEFM